MKAILISIKPQHLVNILNGKKTIEIRKNKALANAIEKLIQEESYATIYVYCSKDNHQLVKPKDYDKYLLFTKGAVDYSREHTLNGKVVCSFKCYKVEEISFDDKEVQRKACLTEDELFDYLFVNEPYHEDMKKGYAIYINDLKIFDTPKELGDFEHEIMIRDNVRGISHEIVPVHRVNDWLYVEILTYN